MQSDFLAALVSCAEGPLQSTVRRFLVGLSSDELQFLANFMGASILEGVQEPCSRALLADRVAEMQRCRQTAGPASDQDHKMILLIEFLCRSGLGRTPISVRTAGGARFSAGPRIA